MLENNQRKELFESIAKLKRAKTFFSTIGETPHGEFIMMHMIDCCNKEKNDCSNEPGIKISVLSERMHMSKPAVSQMLNLLENKGCIERTSTKDDRRVVLVNLTPHGYDLLEEIQRKFLVVVDDIIKKFGEEDTHMLITLLNRLYNTIESLKK